MWINKINLIKQLYWIISLTNFFNYVLLENKIINWDNIIIKIK